jgi:hypothetical protein
VITRGRGGLGERVWAPALGFAGICAAALLGLLGVLRTSRPPAHLADVEGMSRLLDQTQEDREYWRTRALSAEAGWAECERLRQAGRA